MFGCIICINLKILFLFSVAPPPPSHYNYAPPTFTLQTLPPFTLPKLETLPPPPPLPQLFSYYPVAPPPPPPSYVVMKIFLIRT